MNLPMPAYCTEENSVKHDTCTSDTITSLLNNLKHSQTAYTNRYVPITNFLVNSIPFTYIYIYIYIYMKCSAFVRCALHYYYYYYYFFCHRPILPGNSLEPTVIPTAQASSFTLQYFPYYV